MITLGIETSCDETAVSLLKGKNKILASVVYSSLKEHAPYGGVVPEIASRAHTEALLLCLNQALKKAKLNLKQIDLIAVTQGPGLMGSLLVGLSAAKALSLALEVPIVGVDHVLAHAYSGILTNPKLGFPFLALVVSGGHTLLIRMDGPMKVEVLGKTLDDAAGEAFDKVAKMLGLRYPGGPEVDRLSRNQDSSRFAFSRPYISKDSLDFSFSGIKTAVFYTVEKLKKQKDLNLQTKKQICSGFQDAVCEVLVHKSIRAAKSQKLKTIVVGGGVSANSRLRFLFKKEAKKNDLKALFPDFELCQDNASMIAALGAALYDSGKKDTLELSSYSDFSLHQTT